MVVVLYREDAGGQCMEVRARDKFETPASSVLACRLQIDVTSSTKTLSLATPINGNTGSQAISDPVVCWSTRAILSTAASGVDKALSL